MLLLSTYLQGLRAEVVWHVKAEWTLTNEIPKKPKKKSAGAARAVCGRLRAIDFVGIEIIASK